jgi:glutamate-1-semialdehyde aminotransferase
VLAAWLQTLQILEEYGIDHINRLGATLRSGIAHAIADTGAPFILTGLGSSWTVGRKAEHEAVTAVNSAQQLQHSLRAAGIQISPLGQTSHLCVAMSVSDVEETVTAFQKAFKILMTR